MNNEKIRIAAFGGFRSIPPKAGAAGSDKFALELYPRLVSKGHSLLAYSRIYPDDTDDLHTDYVPVGHSGKARNKKGENFVPALFQVLGENEVGLNSVVFIY